MRTVFLVMTLILTLGLGCASTQNAGVKPIPS